MRTFSINDSGGKAFLASRQPFDVADCFTYFLASGAIIRFTTYDKPLTCSGVTWAAPSATGWKISRNRLGVKNTVEIPELELRLSAENTVLFNGQNIKQQIHNGVFDGARVQLDRAFMPTPGNIEFGTVLLFNGRQCGAVIDAEGITLTAKGDNVLMNQQAPRNLYQTNCLHTFCDSGCTLLESAYSFTGQICSPGSWASALVWTVPAGFTASQFTQGKVTMTSGAAIGQVRTVRLAAGIALTLTYPLYDAPAPGDTFTILLGCDRQQNSCQTRTPVAGGTVNNIQHYRGYPYVPQAEIAV
jgi:uncharacterized phage protein (TIGR02218 family)